MRDHVVQHHLPEERMSNDGKADAIRVHDPLFQGGVCFELGPVREIPRRYLAS